MARHPTLAYLIRRTTSRRFLLGNLLFLALACALLVSSTTNRQGARRQRAQDELRRAGKYLRSLAYEDDFSTSTGGGVGSGGGAEQYCSEASYLDGHWVKREVPLETDEDVRRAWGLTVSRRTSNRASARQKGVQAGLTQCVAHLPLLFCYFSLAVLHGRQTTPRTDPCSLPAFASTFFRTRPNSNAKRSMTPCTASLATQSTPSACVRWRSTSGGR